MNTKVKISTRDLLALKNAIKCQAIIRNKGVGKRGRKSKWIFDLRLTLLDSVGLTLATEAMADIVQSVTHGKLYCIGCLTIAADPLVGSLISRLGAKKNRRIKGFIIRKQKKTYGLQKNIEGHLDPKDNIILIDDLINSGNSLKKAVEAIEKKGGKVKHVVVIVDFKKGFPRKFYDDRKIKIHSIFNLDDFGLKLNNYDWKRGAVKDNIKNPLWIIKPLNIKKEPFFRSVPAANGRFLYVGSDSGLFYCFDIEKGMKVWEFLTPTTRKGILSSPLVIEDRVIFGDYNGVVHCLRRSDGHAIWQSIICDYIGSSPVADKKRSLIFIGTEYGNRTKQFGGVSCVDFITGKVKWAMEDEMYVHCTPAYSPRNQAVFFGSNSGKVYSLDCQTGRIRWARRTVGGMNGEVKFKIITDQNESKVYFGSLDENIYCLRASSGMPLWRFQADGRIKFTPLLVGESLVCGTDKGYLYNIDKENGRLLWKTKTEGPLIGGAAYYGGTIFVGDVEGIIFAIDRKSGKTINWVETDDSFYSAPIVHDGRLFIGNKYLQCWEVSELLG